MSRSWISDVRLAPNTASIDATETLDLEVNFRVVGKVREIFNQDTWQKAYDNHDNLFRVKYVIRVENLEPLTFIRKASFYWSRDPNLPPLPPAKKIWAMIILDDSPILPKDVKQAQELLFDVYKRIMITGSNIGKGKHRISADMSVSWNNHTFIEGEEVSARSNEIEVTVK